MNELIDELLADAGERMNKSVESTRNELATVRTGRASPHLLDRIIVDYYGAETPIAFSSFDLNVALAQAAQGREVSGLSRAILYCFSHEPPGQSRFFTLIALIGLATLAALAALFVYLQVTTARARRGKEFDIER